MNLALLTVFLAVCGSGWTILVDDVREDVIGQISTAWTELKKVDRTNKSPEELLKGLARVLKKVPTSISRAERELMIYEYEEPLKALNKVQKKHRSRVSNHWKRKWSEISILTSPVDVLYGHFKIFPDMPESFTPGSDLMDFDASTVSDLILKPIYRTDDKGTITLSYLLDHAHSMVVGSQGKDAFAELSDVVDRALADANWCLWSGKTPQRVIYGFYVSLLTLDIKEYTILNFAYMLEYALNGTESGNDVSFATQSLRNKAYEKQVAAKAAISGASPAYWKCDPRRHIEGESYEQFKELLQGIIENEKDLHPKGSCKQSCTDFTFTKSKCQDALCFSQRKCTGDIVDCKYVAADATACLAEPPRRFDYIDYKKGPFLGKSTSGGRCEGKTERRDSHWRFLYHCSNCLCLCDDPKSPTTVRHISLAPVTTDTLSNRVVTGVRMLMKEGILHLQIEQGIPAKKGYVAEGTTEWKAVPSLSKKYDDNVAQLDYFHRAFNLDDIILSKNYVVTGVRFHRIGEHIGLMVQATQINPITAELLHSTTHWQANDNTPENSRSPRRLLSLDDADVPTYSPRPSVPDSVHDQYFSFGPTGRENDVAQTTIPFMDIQPVRPSPPVWLHGVGIYHKGQPGYGGYIAPRVFTSDASEFMAEDEK